MKKVTVSGLLAKKQAGEKILLQSRRDFNLQILQEAPTTW